MVERAALECRARPRVQPPEGSSGESKKQKAHERRRDPLPPLVSAALEPATTSLEARLARISARSHGRTRYTVLGELAEGGMGKILRAWDEALSREVALKVVPREPAKGSSDEERADHERRLARFIDEARITAQLDHPGIVPVYEIGLDETGAVFFAMPLVRGRDLKSVFALVHSREDGWTLPRAVGVMHAVCLTVAFAHSRGVVHRDLKPENVMVGPFGEAYVMDWGLAFLLGRAERGGIVGTPAYMSPEQAAGDSSEVGPRSDVYSLGAMLYELFARRMPHEVSLEGHLDGHRPLHAVLTVPPRPLSELREDVPAELAAICGKAMARDPAERYESAREMADDLAAWLEGRVVSALDSGPWTRFRKWRARNRGLAFAVEALIALLLVGSWAFILQERVRVREVQAQSRHALATAYAAGLSAADLGLRAHEIAESKRRLGACDEALRGWEWRHLSFRADPSAHQIAAGHGAARAVAVHPDGARVAAGYDDGTVLILDAEDGTERARLEQQHNKAITAIAFSPDGTSLASASRDKTARVWDATTGLHQSVVGEHDAELVAVAFSPDGRVLATGDGPGGITLSTPGNGAPLHRRRPEEHEGLAALEFVPGTGELAAAYLTGVVRLFGPDLTPVREAQVGSSTLGPLDADPSGRFLAVAFDRTVLVLDTATLARLHLFDAHGSKVSSVAFSPDGTRLATGCYDNVVRLWDVEDESLECAYDGHELDVNAVAFFPDGRRLLTSAEDESLRVWDLSRAAVSVFAEHRGWVDALAFSPDGTKLLTGGHDRTLRMVDPATGGQLASATTPDIVDCVAWNADDRIAFGCGDPSPRVTHARDLSAWTELPPLEGTPRAMVFGGEGQRLFVRASKGAIGVYDLALGALAATLETDDDMSTSLAVTRDGFRLAAGTADGTVILWDGYALIPFARWTANTTSVTTLAFSPDGSRLAVARKSRVIEVYVTHTGELLRALTGHEGMVSCLAFSPDGSRLVSGAYDHRLRVWDPVNDEALLTIQGHEEPVTAVTFDPSGEILASASKDASVRLWRTARSYESEKPAPHASK